MNIFEHLCAGRWVLWVLGEAGTGNSDGEEAEEGGEQNWVGTSWTDRIQRGQTEARAVATQPASSLGWAQENHGEQHLLCPQVGLVRVEGP